MRKRLLVAAAVLMAGCAKRKPVAPVVPPAPVVKTPARRAAPPKAPVPAVVPAVPVVPAERAPVSLQSSAEPVPDRVAVEGRIRETQGVLGQLRNRNLTGTAKADGDRAASMLDLAQKALSRGDLRGANDLSARASALAKTILNAK